MLQAMVLSKHGFQEQREALPGGRRELTGRNITANLDMIVPGVPRSIQGRKRKLTLD